MLRLGITLSILWAFTNSNAYANPGHFENWVNQHSEELASDGKVHSDPKTYTQYLGRVNDYLSTRSGCRQYQTLSDDTKVALGVYSEYGYYYLNSSLYSNSSKNIKEVAPFAEALSNALSSLPSKVGTVYRCTHFSPLESSQIVTGSILPFRGFTSTSTLAGWLDNLYCKNRGETSATIFVQHGHDISCFSILEDEKEWLLDKGTSFSVQRTMITPDRFFIELHESVVNPD